MIDQTILFSWHIKWVMDYPIPLVIYIVSVSLLPSATRIFKLNQYSCTIPMYVNQTSTMLWHFTEHPCIQRLVFLNFHTLGVLNTSKPNGLAVPDANIQPVTTTSDVVKLMDIGLKNRARSSTALNERSSRSHRFLNKNLSGYCCKS